MWRKALRIGTGVFMVLLGVTGLILPIMPGWIFLIPGLMILGEFFPPIQRLVNWAKKRWEHYEPEAFRRYKSPPPKPEPEPKFPEAS